MSQELATTGQKSLTISIGSDLSAVPSGICCIYKIINTANGNFYIGLTTNVKHRIYQHRAEKTLRKNNTVLIKAFKKYGLQSFVLEVIEECEPEQLSVREEFWIKELSPIYNMNEGGLGNRGHLVSDEVKKRLSDISKIQWNNKTKEQKNWIINNNLSGPKVGHIVSNETKNKLRNANLGKKQHESVGRRISLALKGKSRPNLKHYKPVIRMIGEREYGIYNSVKSAAEENSVNSSQITSVLKGRRKTSGGYQWKYFESINCLHNPNQN